jgi:valyl-tRNA synthetase
MVDKKKYNALEVESKIREFWETEKIYQFNVDSKKKIYSIDTPPPTVSGKMHMGHAFGNSQQDFIARYKRMNGFNVLQPFGTDDNGLPTKLLIERLKKVDSSKMPRKEFVKLVLETLEKELRPQYIEDWKRLGISCDFGVFYTTINEHSQRISQKSFLDLYKVGRQYRKESATMYCPKCQTAISQVECEDKEKHSAFNDIVFKSDGKDLIIATTRPELLPACVAIFYHPTDERYQKLNGKKAKVPLFDFEVPILEDERADPEKGTGIVMCCTFGDSTDVEWQKAHNLPIKEAIDKKGKMTELAGGYNGMNIEEARKKIIEDLKTEKLLVKQEPITHFVNVHERCGTDVEFIHSKQWFVKYLDLKPKMLKWGKELNWYPSYMKNRYENWIKGLQWDWCISRQLPYGVPFPVWYCKNCDEVVLANEKDLPVDPTEDKSPVDKCPKCSCNEFIPEKDIINTWATSSLTPTIVKELFKGTPVYDYLIKNPMDLRPQGHDIITFWLFNTVVKSQLHFEMKPWKDCFINGWMLDPKGKKMSKSKGNIIEPQEMIDKYSADALRFMAASSKLGEDLPFPEKDLVTGKRMITKLWNANKFVFMNLEDYKCEKPKKLEKIDELFLVKLNELVKLCTKSFENYEFSRSKLETEKFFWSMFADNYLEIVKKRVYNETGERKISAQYTLYKSMFTILKLIAPIMPFVTEEIYQTYFKKNENEKSIHLTSWPEENSSLKDIKTEAFDVFLEVLSKVRQEKSNNQKPMNAEIILSLNKKEYGILKEMLSDLKDVSVAKEIKEGKFGVEFV